VVQSGALKLLAKKVERLQAELDSIDDEMAQLDAAKLKPGLAEGPQVNSLQQVRVA
jgi:hypothetical protein